MPLLHVWSTKLLLRMKQVLDNIENIVAEGECFELRVKGYSMLPMLGMGDDVIIVQRVGTEADIVGYVAIFRGSHGQIIVHRVLSVEGDKVVLRGDGNIVQTEVCRRSEIIGIVVKVRRASGKVVDCESRRWRWCERVWLRLPKIVRRYLLAVLRRVAEYKQKK